MMAEFPDFNDFFLKKAISILNIFDEILREIEAIRIEGLFVKIQEITLIIIFVIFPQKSTIMA